MLKELAIEILRRCPNHCIYCSSMSDDSCQEIICLEKYSEIITAAAQLGAKTVSISGGEPFLHPELGRMVDFAESKGLSVRIYTSGIVFDASGKPCAVGKKHLQELKHNHPKLIYNIEACTEKIYDTIMGTHGRFHLMQQSVTAAVAEDFVVEAHFVPMALNIKEIQQVCAMCEELKLQQISMLRLVLHGRAAENIQKLHISEKRLEELKTHLAELHAGQYGIRIGVPLLLDTSCCKCEAGNGKLSIRYDGMVYPCEAFKNGIIDCWLQGCIPESIFDKGLADIYKSSPYLQAARELTAWYRYSGCSQETCVVQYLMGKKSGRDTYEQQGSRNAVELPRSYQQ